MTTRERFSSGWTGAVAVALFAYIAVAIAADPRRRQAVAGCLDVFNLYSDSLASIGVTILAAAAARGSSDPAARRTWWLLTAALCVYSVGNLLHSTYWLFGVDPFPSIGDVFFLGFYPLVFAAVLTVIRSAAVRVQWARLGLDATILHAGLRRILLVLRDRAHRGRRSATRTCSSTCWRRATSPSTASCCWPAACC